MKNMVFPKVPFLIAIAVVVSGTSFSLRSEVLKFELLQDNSIENMYPGADGLLGTGDDQLSDQPSPVNTSEPNKNGSFSFNAFDFGTGLTDAPLMPTGFNAIAFVLGSASVDTEAFSSGGAILQGWDIDGTEPFIGHGMYDSQMTKANSGTYNINTGEFTMNVDFIGNLIAGSAEGMNFNFNGEAWLVDSKDFETFDRNAYVRDVLIPKARSAGASKLVFINGSGTVPASSGGSGGSFPQMPIKGVFIGIYIPGKWLVNDFNGDKRTDLPWRNPGNGQNRLWLMNGKIREMAGSIPSIDPDWIVAGTGDFDRDEKVDIYWRNQVTGVNRIWFMDGKTRKGFATTLRMFDTDWQVGAICDLNNDGNADIVWRHASLPRTRVWIMDGPVQTDKMALPKIINEWFVAACADFDGDGNDDILWRHSSNGQLRIWFMHGVIRKNSGAIQLISNNFRVGGAGDFTRDGRADILFHNDSNGQSRLWVMDGLVRIFGKALKLQFTTFSGVAIGDYGGDGKLDIFWRNRINGRNQIWNMDGADRMSIDYVVVMPTDYFAVP